MWFYYNNPKEHKQWHGIINAVVVVQVDTEMLEHIEHKWYN